MRQRPHRAHGAGLALGERGTYGTAGRGARGSQGQQGRELQPGSPRGRGGRLPLHGGRAVLAAGWWGQSPPLLAQPPGRGRGGCGWSASVRVSRMRGSGQEAAPAGSTCWTRADLGQKGSVGTRDSTWHDPARAAGAWAGGGAELSLDTRLWVLNFLKNTLFGFLLFLENYRKCEPHRNVSLPGPTLGCQLTLPPGTGGFSIPLPPGLSGRASVRASRRSPTWRS